uniref:HD transcription factor n=1 Tax=Gnetum gnemon TaxID=3382 RepID=S6D6M6_GNEGN|nr:HD transcription factor [Gnetum gnemon]
MAEEGMAMGIHGRWNPIKEQVEMLERFYNDGIRTPSAVQIDDMTAQLRRYGPIQGKNVFYWFQNRKARLRNQLRQSHQQQQHQIQQNQRHPLFFNYNSLAPTPDCTQSIRAIRPIPILPLPLPLPSHHTCQTEVVPSPEKREIEILELFPLHPEGLALGAKKTAHLQTEPERSSSLAFRE